MTSILKVLFSSNDIGRGRSCLRLSLGGRDLSLGLSR